MPCLSLGVQPSCEWDPILYADEPGRTAKDARLLGSHCGLRCVQPLPSSHVANVPVPVGWREHGNASSPLLRRHSIC